MIVVKGEPFRASILSGRSSFLAILGNATYTLGVLANLGWN
jgi:hypothetical protein